MPKLLDLVQTLDDGAASGEMVESLFNQWSQHRSEEPLAALSSIKNPALSERGMMGMLRGWSRADASSAFSYMIDNHSDPVVAKVLPEVGRNWAQHASAEDMKALPERLAGVEGRDDILGNMVASVAFFGDPEQAVGLALSIGNESQRERGVRSAVSGWARNDLGEAEAYVSTLADEGLRAGATQSLIFANIQKGSGADRLLALADGFEDPKNSEKLLGILVSQAARERKEGKGEALAQLLESELPGRSDISEETRSKMLDALNE